MPNDTEMVTDKPQRGRLQTLQELLAVIIVMAAGVWLGSDTAAKIKDLPTIRVTEQNNSEFWFFMILGLLLLWMIALVLGVLIVKYDSLRPPRWVFYLGGVALYGAVVFIWSLLIIELTNKGGEPDYTAMLSIYWQSFLYLAEGTVVGIAATFVMDIIRS